MSFIGGNAAERKRAPKIKDVPSAPGGEIEEDAPKTWKLEILKVGLLVVIIALQVVDII